MSKEDGSDYRTSHVGKGSWGDGYDATLFSPGSYDSVVWQQEKELLVKLIETRVPNRDCYLDFACGTGRVLSHLESFFKSSIGLDVSETMLEQARKKIRKATLICGDGTRSPEFLNGNFDCITAWRFFLNAETELRDEAMAFLSGKLRSSESVLMFNIHGNRHSSRCLMMALNRLRGQKHNNDMSFSEVQYLIKRHGLEIIEWHGLNLLDKSFYNYMPKTLWRIIEFTLSPFKFFKQFSVYIVFVCRKKEDSKSNL